jgi:predicted XRE-type DNA-binding protein
VPEQSLRCGETTGREAGGILAQRGLTQAEAAKVLGVNQPKVSALKGVQAGGVLRGSG